VSIVPYRNSPRARKRAPLDRAQIVATALVLLDEAGLDSLTMRSLAERLGVKAASLYRHVRDKEELLTLLADEISGEIAVECAGRTWQQQLLDKARRLRRGLQKHRDAARLLSATMPAGPRRLRHIETTLRILLSAGLTGRDAARAAYHMNNLVTEFASDEARITLAAEALGVTRRELLAGARQYFRELPPGEFPSLSKLANHVADDNQDGLFEFGLQVWLRGLERLIEIRTFGRGGR